MQEYFIVVATEREASSHGRQEPTFGGRAWPGEPQSFEFLQVEVNHGFRRLVHVKHDLGAQMFAPRQASDDRSPLGQRQLKWQVVRQLSDQQTSCFGWRSPGVGRREQTNRKGAQCLRVAGGKVGSSQSPILSDSLL